MQGVIARTLHALEARDPARERLRKMISVVAGILGSLLWGYAVVHFLHVETGMLTISVFLSMMSGLFVKDSTARARVVSTALLVPTAVAVPLVAVSLSSQRVLQLAVFVLISGVAVWVRRFGPRATTIGTLSFFACFFTLLMRPTMAELPAFCLIAAGAVASQLVVQLILWARRHPERELGVLLGELRVASAAAIEAATSPARPHALQARLARVDSMWRAITAWQQSFRTANYTGWDHEKLAVHVLDACVNTDEACLELSEDTDAHHRDSADRRHAIAQALVALDDHVSRAQLDQATSWAEGVVGDESRTADAPSTYRLAECVLAHAHLRTVELHRRPPARLLAGQATSAVTPSTVPDHPAPGTPRAGSSDGRRRIRWTPWRQWAPTSRLAIQAMTATAIASAVGEAISASRWYWAVLTAFLVFFSTTTRSGILTRAYRRIIGTVLGLAVGIAVTYLAHDVKVVLLAICLLCVMGMIYFGPLNYMYLSFFVTVLLISLYAVLGVLDGHLMEVRLEETVAGAGIGVLCAYLLLSATSRPALVQKIDAYFDAVDTLMAEASDLVAAPDRDTAMLDRVHAVEAAQADVDQTISAMSTAFLIAGRDRVDSAISLMYRSSRSSVRLAQIVMLGAAHPDTAEGLAREHDVVQDAVAAARDAADRARRRIERPTEPAADRDEPTAQSTAGRSSNGGDATVAAALVALDRFTWVMGRLCDVLAPSDQRARGRARTLTHNR